MTSRQLRLLRGAAASSIATIIAAVSHTVGGGVPPHPLLILALSVFLTPVTALLVGRTPRLGRLSTAVVSAQMVFHVLFVMLGATASPTVSTGHNHVLSLDPLTATVAPDAGMLGAHVAAAALTIMLLWRGEQLVRAVARWVQAALRPRMPSVHAEWPTPQALATTTHHLVSALRTGDISLRGPPAFSRG